MRTIDLTQTIHPKMQVFPTYPQPCVIPWTRRNMHGFESEAILIASHTGTHIDAPYHFVEEGYSVESIPVTKLMHDAILLDLTFKTAKSQITVQDILKAEEALGVQASEKDIVILRTGWDTYLGKQNYLESYPGIDGKAAQLFVERSISAIGVDTPNPDHPDDPNFPAHHILLKNEVLIIENLCNLNSIGSSRFRFIGLPLKIQGATGSPIRAIATVD